MLGDIDSLKLDLVQLARLVINEQIEDACLFVARLVRKYRNTTPDLAKQIESFLRNKPARTNSALRKVAQFAFHNQALPTEEEGHRALLKIFKDKPNSEPPLLSTDVGEMLNQLIQERRRFKYLASRGLHPTRSAIFFGKPGVGKTLTARWLAAQLEVPFFVLDLTTVMSSLLGKTGNNLRAALDFAKRGPCVLLLDEVDAIAKRRNDDTDVGELKRLVTVILQEVDEWPASGLLLAATNHPELIDTALWRRFDLVIKFKLPEIFAVKEAVKRFLGPDHDLFERWIDIFTLVFNGQSFSDIERTIQRFRRASALGMNSHLIEELIKSRASELERQPKIELALLLNKNTNLSQHAISDFTGVSRDTIRKYSKLAQF
jgi:SpoVK/Ycf46/Vps4 family AAA+-type ATPase